MNIEQLTSSLPIYAKDIKLNLATVLSEEGAPDLTLRQIHGIALASAFTTKNQMVINAFLKESFNHLSAEEINAAKAAALMMAMNNIYYRFTHLMSDKDYSVMPAKLRMNIIANPGIERIDFELYCLAISTLNGCGLCMNAHANELVKSTKVTKLAIQSTVRIASVLNALALAVTLSDN